MSELHEVTCDKCGTKEKMRNGRSGEYTDSTRWLLPDDWGCNMKKDLCPKCIKKLEELSFKFLKD